MFGLHLTLFALFPSFNHMFAIMGGGGGGFLKSYMPLVAALSESESDDTQATLISVLLELSLTTSERLHLRDDCFSSLKLVKHF